MTHVLLACTKAHCQRNAFEVWGWKEIRIPPHRHLGAIDDNGDIVTFVSNVQQILALPASSKIYLGYHSQFAYGGNVQEALAAHRARGGQVIDDLPQWQTLAQ